jgi:hypothetical protein
MAEEKCEATPPVAPEFLAAAVVGLKDESKWPAEVEGATLMLV